MKYRPINKILIANRGEIALRIIKTIHSLGKKAVVVHGRGEKTTLVAVAVCPDPGKHVVCLLMLKGQ